MKKFFRTMTILTVYLISFNLIVLAEEFDPLNVRGVRIVGNVEVPEELIVDLLSIKNGGEFSSKNMREDYIKLKGSKYLDNVEIYPEVLNGIVYVVKIKEKSGVKEILKTDGIVPLSEREKIDKSLIITSIEVYGNHKISREEILKNVPINIGGYFSKEKILEGKKNILQTGFFKDVNTEVLKYNNGIFIKYNVIENPVIKSIEISGNKLVSKEDLIALMQTKSGEIYNINTLRKDTDNIRAYYTEKGYALAEIYDIRLDEELNLLIQVTEGIVRDIRFERVLKTEENTGGKVDDTKKDMKLKTQNFVLERELEIKKGEVFILNDYKNTVKNLFRLGYFKDVKPEFEKIPNDPDGVNLVLKLDEQKSGSINGSISYGSSAGLMGGISVSDDNFRGNSQRLAVSFELTSKSKEKYELSFSDPWIKGTQRLSMSTSIYRKYEENKTTETYSESEFDIYNNIQTDGLTLSIGKGLTKYFRVRMGAGVKKVKKDLQLFIYETAANEETGLMVTNKNELEYDDEKVPQELKDDYAEEDYTLITFSPSITYDDRNNPYDANSGKYARLSLGSGYRLKSNDYYSIEAEYRQYYSFLSDKNSFAYRLITGAVSNDAPSSEWYVVGGGNSLRGYRGESGKTEFFANFENRYKIEENFQLVIFYDIGKAWLEYSDFMDLSTLRQNYGVGIRMTTPIGPLRFDFGWPAFDSEKKNPEFNFGMGQLF